MLRLSNCGEWWFVCIDQRSPISQSHLNRLLLPLPSWEAAFVSETQPNRLSNSHLTEMEDHSMKNLMLAAFAALSLTAAVVSAANAANTVTGDTQATRLQQSGAYGPGG